MKKKLMIIYDKKYRIKYMMLSARDTRVTSNKMINASIVYDSLIL